MEIACVTGFGPDRTFKDDVVWFIERMRNLIARVERQIRQGKGDLAAKANLLVRMKTRLDQLKELRDSLGE